MTELKFINSTDHKDPKDMPPSCSCQGSVTGKESRAKEGSSAQSESSLPVWVEDSVITELGPVPRISTDLTASDYWEHAKCRISAFRNNYTIKPGLYAVGVPDRSADVVVSANYKLSFDLLRKALKDLNVWILVLDTKGINVWCAAGKGTFGTDELIRLISITKLDRIIEHRRIIVPQLGAPGISAHKVKKATGFKVCYGPVRAEDIGSYIAAGYKATREMRRVTFPLIERLILTPMEINPAMKKYYPWYALITLTIFGLQPEGIFFKDALAGGIPFLLLGLISVFAGALLTPALLPVIPFRSFAVKGWIIGLLAVFLSDKSIAILAHFDRSLHIFSYLFFPLASSYIALQFTGSTTFTGMSGVKKELKISLPLYISGVVVSLILLCVYKLTQWRLI